jgi:putative glycosyltransferase (TIGR04372 family)
MINILEWALNKLSSHKFFYVTVPWDISIGIGSELIRLNLVKASILGKKVTFIKAGLPFSKLITKVRYPQKIYTSIVSELIRPEFFLLRIFLEYHQGFKFVVFRIIRSMFFSRKVFNYEPSSVNHWIYASPNKYYESRPPNCSLLKIGRAFRNLPKVRLMDHINVDCKSAFRELGLKDNWYVCLHIRTSNFYKDNADYRNANIQNYYQAINYIISQGGLVVRMGDAVDGLIKSPIKGFIDYPNSVYKSELMDLYLIENCRFYWGTQSGIIDTALLFGKPVLSVNSINFAMPGMGKHNLTIYKRILDRKKNICLSFEESISLYNEIISSSYIEFSKNYEWIENSSEEIFEAVLEFFEAIDKEKLSVTSFQINANKILRKIARGTNYPDNLVSMQAIFSRVFFGRHYLQNWMK